MNDFLQRLQQRKLVQWAIAYGAFAFALIQVLDVVADSYGWPRTAMHIVFGVLVLGFVVTLILAWYHGERGAQRISGPELLLIALALVIGGGLLWHFARAPTKPAMNGVALTHSGRPTAASASGAMANKTSMAAAPTTPATTLATSRSTAQPIPAKSVAVLPFENLSTDKGNAYFADGIQDLILTKLADIGDLKVIARTSTQSYGSHPQNLTVVGQQLGVATILEGSVQKAGNQVLINVQLIDAKTDAHIWAESYTRTLDNIFGVEGEVAEKVATALNAKLTTAEAARVSKVPTRNTAAYDAFLQGEYYAQRAVANVLSLDFEKAEAYYRQAVAQDPQFALAWARLSFVSAAQQQMTFTGDQQPVLAAQAKMALDRALALAPDSPSVRLVQGWYDHWIAHDLKAALAAFDSVLAMQPQNAQALFGACVVRQHLGQYREAVELCRKAVDHSPKSATLLVQLGIAELDVRDYTRAQQTLRHALALDPDSAYALDHLMNSYFLVGDPDGAKKLLDAASKELQGNPTIAGMSVSIALQRRDYATARKASAQMQNGGRYSEAFANVQRGNVEWLAGDLPLARQYYQRAALVYQAEVEHHPDNANALSGFAWILMRLGKDKEALARSQRAIEIASQRRDRADADAYDWQMARILGQLGKGDKAAAILGDLLSRPSGVPITAASLKIDWVWDPIRHDPAFQALLKKYQNAPAMASSTGAQP